MSSFVKSCNNEFILAKQPLQNSRFKIDKFFLQQILTEKKIKSAVTSLYWLFYQMKLSMLATLFSLIYEIFRTVN